MTKFLPLIMASVLAACGGTGSEDNTSTPVASDTPVMDINIPHTLKGPETEPALTPLSISEGDIVKLNSALYGSKTGGEDYDVFLETQHQQPILVQVDSSEGTDQDVILITSENTSPIKLYQSNQLTSILFTPSSEKYRIRYVSQDSKDFSLRIVEANRETPNFHPDDYLVEVSGLVERECTGQDLNTYNRKELLLINWQRGEFWALNQSENPTKQRFEVLDETTFELNMAEGTTQESSSNEQNHIVSIDPRDNYKITYNFRDASYNDSEVSQRVCTTQYSAEGEIVL